MGKRIVYIVCHNDETERISHEYFDKYSWARVYRIPDDAQSYLMESVMYQTELMKVYDEWKDADYVGTLSYKLPARIEKGALIDINKFDNTIQNLIHDNIAVAAITYVHAYVDTYLCLRKVVTDTCQKIGITLSRKSYDIRTRKFGEVSELDIKPFIFHNYWVTRPNIMKSYIDFFNTKWLPALESHPNVWDDAVYTYNTEIAKTTSSERLLLRLTNGRVSHYPYHAIACERLPSIFFMTNGIPYIMS